MLRPLTSTWPEAFTATACAMLFVDPPRNVENTSPPLGSSLATNDRSFGLTGAVPSVAPPVTGKSGEFVTPAMYALPATSTVIA